MPKAGMNFLKRGTTHVAFRNAVVAILAIAAACTPMLPYSIVRDAESRGGGGNS
ncbi:hypothetical protein FHX77_000763 [Bifidobacterium commune]|uniref:Uncharacterized protein n=1 Tax=Bifidobacterium commune TaxID=1505727 RepID=A0A1C4H0B3_9BIFI|nr:hypothetical protein [Bifidobacterium commune]SCC78364.1 hypothetical protein GA0061077_0227 [Bifidobacterium commune]